jgi:hypothetical protein
MKIITEKILLDELQVLAKNIFGNFIKAVVDLEKEIMAIDAELHADEEGLLLSQGSKQLNLWGINLYPEFYGSDDFVEFDSMINLRPSQNNRSRNIESAEIREKVLNLIKKLIIK